MISRLSDENIDIAAKQSMADQEKMHQRASSMTIDEIIADNFQIEGAVIKVYQPERAKFQLKELLLSSRPEELDSKASRGSMFHYQDLGYNKAIDRYSKRLEELFK